MDLNEFVIKLIFLLIPGIIGSIIYRKLKANKEKKTWEDFLEVFLFSFFSYAILGLTSTLKNLEVLSKSSSSNINWIEIFWASIISFFLAYIAAFFHNYKLVNKLGRLIKVTKCFGDDDVWEYLHNSPDVDWVLVRDHKFDLIYFGNIIAFSESKKKRELILRKVSVHRNSTGEYMYNMEAIYFSKDACDFTIEIPLFSNSLPEKIEIPDFEENVIKKLKKNDRDFISKYYVKDSSNNLYSLIPGLARKKRLKIRLILESIKFPITYNEGKFKKTSKEVKNGRKTIE